jgi:hypothetical protein
MLRQHRNLISFLNERSTFRSEDKGIRFLGKFNNSYENTLPYIPQEMCPVFVFLHKVQLHFLIFFDSD